MQENCLLEIGSKDKLQENKQKSDIFFKIVNDSCLPVNLRLFATMTDNSSYKGV